MRGKYLRLTRHSCRNLTHAARDWLLVLGLSMVAVLVHVIPAHAVPKMLMQRQSYNDPQQGSPSLTKRIYNYAKSCSQQNQPPGCRKLALELWKNLSLETFREVGTWLRGKSRGAVETGRHNPQAFIVASGIFSVIMDAMTAWSEKFKVLATTLGPQAERSNGLQLIVKAIRLLSAYLETAPPQLRGTAAIWGVNLCAYLKHVAEANPWISQLTRSEIKDYADMFFATLQKEFHESNLSDAKHHIDNEHATRALSVHNWMWGRDRETTGVLAEGGDRLTILMQTPRLEPALLGEEEEKLSTTSPSPAPGSSSSSEDSLSQEDRDDKGLTSISIKALRKDVQDNMPKALPQHTTFFWHYLVAETAVKILSHKGADLAAPGAQSPSSDSTGRTDPAAAIQSQSQVRPGSLSSFSRRSNNSSVQQNKLRFNKSNSSFWPGGY